jgi:hypothetical protein
MHCSHNTKKTARTSVSRCKSTRSNSPVSCEKRWEWLLVSTHTYTHTHTHACTHTHAHTHTHTCVQSSLISLTLVCSSLTLSFSVLTRPALRAFSVLCHLSRLAGLRCLNGLVGMVAIVGAVKVSGICRCIRVSEEFTRA